MSNIAIFPNIYKKSESSRFGLAEGFLRVLARKIPDADLGDAALIFQMTILANRLRQDNLYDFNNQSPQAIENLIELMQFAEHLTDLAKNRQATEKILSLLEEIQNSEEKYSNIVDVMVLIADRDDKNATKP